MKAIFFWLVAFNFSVSLPAIANNSNKSLVIEFYQTMFVNKQVKQALSQFVGDTYIQHNPYVPNGTQPLENYFIPFFKNNPDASITIKRSIAEDDLVVIHSHWKKNKNDRGQAVMDIFRVENSKIVEHWDVVQNVPEKSANTNTMF